MSANNGGPAFPEHDAHGAVYQQGMTLRDYFAAAALTGFLSGQPANALTELGVLAEMAYSRADALLAERAK